MGVYYYPVFDRKVDSLPTELCVDGKAIARAMPLLDRWAKELGVRDMMSFYSESNEESFASIGEEVPPGLKETPIEWTEPGDGLRTVRAYLERAGTVSDRTLRFADSKGRKVELELEHLLADLQALERELVHAKSRGCRFRLRISI
jgi:hypothetical protein